MSFDGSNTGRWSKDTLLLIRSSDAVFPGTVSGIGSEIVARAEFSANSSLPYPYQP